MWKSLWTRLRAARQRRRDIAELDGFDARQLEDLGITRDQIPDYVSGALIRPMPVALTRASNVIPFPVQCCAHAA